MIRMEKYSVLMKVEDIDKKCYQKKDELLKKNSNLMVYSTLYPCSPFLPYFMDIVRAEYNSKKLFNKGENQGIFTWTS